MVRIENILIVSFMIIWDWFTKIKTIIHLFVLHQQRSHAMNNALVITTSFSDVLLTTDPSARVNDCLLL